MQTVSVSRVPFASFDKIIEFSCYFASFLFFPIHPFTLSLNTWVDYRNPSCWVKKPSRNGVTQLRVVKENAPLHWLLQIFPHTLSIPLFVPFFFLIGRKYVEKRTSKQAGRDTWHTKQLSFVTAARVDVLCRTIIYEGSELLINI